MIEYKIDVLNALKEKGFTSKVSKETGTFSQSTMTKFNQGDATISLDSLNKLCTILEMEPEEIIRYKKEEADERYLEYVKRLNEK